MAGVRRHVLLWRLGLTFSVWRGGLVALFPHSAFSKALSRGGVLISSLRLVLSATARAGGRWDLWPAWRRASLSGPAVPVLGRGRLRRQNWEPRAWAARPGALSLCAALASARTAPLPPWGFSSEAACLPAGPTGSGQRRAQSSPEAQEPRESVGCDGEERRVVPDQVPGLCVGPGALRSR